MEGLPLPLVDGEEGLPDSPERRVSVLFVRSRVSPSERIRDRNTQYPTCQCGGKAHCPMKETSIPPYQTRSIHPPLSRTGRTFACFTTSVRRCRLRSHARDACLPPRHPHHPCDVPRPKADRTKRNGRKGPSKPQGTRHRHRRCGTQEKQHVRRWRRPTRPMRSRERAIDSRT